MQFIKSKPNVLAISAAVLLTACAGPNQVTLPDGTVAYAIACDGSPAGMNYCFERAGKSCGAEGYTIVDNDGSVISTSAAVDQDSQALVRLRAYSTDQSSMLVKCGS